MEPGTFGGGEKIQRIIRPVSNPGVGMVVDLAEGQPLREGLLDHAIFYDGSFALGENAPWPQKAANVIVAHALGLTQKQVADVLGMPPHTVKNYEEAILEASPAATMHGTIGHSFRENWLRPIVKIESLHKFRKHQLAIIEELANDGAYKSIGDELGYTPGGIGYILEMLKEPLGLRGRIMPSIVTFGYLAGLLPTTSDKTRLY